MLAKLNSMSVIGIDAFEIGIEADISEMLPSFAIVGLPDGAVRESRERVMSAIKNCGYEFPLRKVTINMSHLTRTVLIKYFKEIFALTCEQPPRGFPLNMHRS